MAMSWFKGIFSSSPPLPEHDEEFDQVWEAVREPTEREVDQIEEALSLLLEAGIVLGPMYDGMPLREVAVEIGSACELIDEVAAKGLRPGDWADVLLSQQRDWDDYEGFNNAVYFQDPCFDGADANTLNQFIRRIVSLTGDDWKVEKVSCGETFTTDQPLDFRRPIRITIAETLAVSKFECAYDENFERALIQKLNEHLPVTAKGRFAFKETESSLVVVYLLVDGIKKLNTLCGHIRRFETERT